MEKAIGSPDIVPMKPIDNQTGKIVENGRVSTIVNAINTNSSIRGRMSNSSSKDELNNKDLTPDKVLKDTLNTSSSSVSLFLIFNCDFFYLLIHK